MLDTVEKIKELIKMLESEARNLSQSVPLYENVGQHTYTKDWIVQNWQINHDIDKLRALAFDLKFNKSIVDARARNSLAAQLRERYQVA